VLQQVKVEVEGAKGERLEVGGQSSKHSVLQQVKVEVEGAKGERLEVRG